jgi:hypothetical protein
MALEDKIYLKISRAEEGKFNNNFVLTTDKEHADSWGGKNGKKRRKS